MSNADDEGMPAGLVVDEKHVQRGGRGDDDGAVGEGRESMAPRDNSRCPHFPFPFSLS
jgi:hypothetical protein